MKGKTIYTKRLGKKVAAGTKIIDPNRYHIIRSDGQKWAVVADGKKRALRVFPNQEEAKSFAKKTAIKSNGKVVIHETTGAIDKVVSFHN